MMQKRASQQPTTAPRSESAACLLYKNEYVCETVSDLLASSIDFYQIIFMAMAIFL